MASISFSDIFCFFLFFTKAVSGINSRRVPQAIGAIVVRAEKNAGVLNPKNAEPIRLPIKAVAVIIRPIAVTEAILQIDSVFVSSIYYKNEPNTDRETHSM